MLAAIGALLGMLTAALSGRAALLAENMMLRQQLAVLRRRAPRPRLGVAHRLFWVLARRLSASWRDALVLVRPEARGWRRAQGAHRRGADQRVINRLRGRNAMGRWSSARRTTKGAWKENPHAGTPASAISGLEPTRL